MPEVRLIDDEGNQIGVLKTADALELRAGARTRPRRGRARGAPAGVPGARLLQVQVRAGPEAQAGAQAPAADHDSRDQVPPQDRPARLRHQEAPRGALSAPQGQGEDHDHVPRARGHPPRARRGDPRPARRRAVRARRGRAAPDAGRAQHDDDDGPLQGGARGARGHRARHQRRGGRGRPHRRCRLRGDRLAAEPRPLAEDSAARGPGPRQRAPRTLRPAVESSAAEAPVGRRPSGGERRR